MTTQNARLDAVSQTHCRHGHEFTPENTLLSGGRRNCRACNRVRAQQSRERRKRGEIVEEVRPCVVTGCDRPRRPTRRYCVLHVRRLATTGTTEPALAARNQPLGVRFWRFVPTGLSPDECWDWQGGRTATGYGTVREMQAHRAAWIVAHGEIPEGLVVRHKCDRPICVNPNHLELGTHLDNAADKILRGRNRTHVLTDVDRAWIGPAVDDGMTASEIADLLGVSVGYAQALARQHSTRRPIRTYPDTPSTRAERDEMRQRAVVRQRTGACD